MSAERLYAPLRAAIYADVDGRVRFAIDQPSTVFDSFGTPEITGVGYELDKKLAALLTTLDAPVPHVLAPANARPITRVIRMEAAPGRVSTTDRCLLGLASEDCEEPVNSLALIDG